MSDFRAPLHSCKDVYSETILIKDKSALISHFGFALRTNKTLTLIGPK